MNRDIITTTIPMDLLVLCADVVGHMEVLERQGSSKGLLAIAALTELLEGVVKNSGGEMRRRLEDGIVAVFSDPANGLRAAAHMLDTTLGASATAGTGVMKLRLGMHFGSTIDDGDELFGECPLVANAVTRLANPEQALSTEDMVLALPQDLSWSLRAVDDLEVAAMEGRIPLYELVVDDDDITLTTGQISETESRYRALELIHKTQAYLCDASKPSLTLGRDLNNDVVITTTLTSRHHACISLSQGQVVVKDTSTNGTVVINDNGQSIIVREEESVLKGSGRLCLGGNAIKNPEGLVRFQCLS